VTVKVAVDRMSLELLPALNMPPDHGEWHRGRAGHAVVTGPVVVAVVVRGDGSAARSARTPPALRETSRRRPGAVREHRRGTLIPNLLGG